MRSMIVIDVGQRFGRWTVAETGLRHLGKRSSRCICDCGTESVVNNSGLSLGKSTSCGCLRMEKLGWAKNPEKRAPKPANKSKTIAPPVEQKQPPPGPRLIELTDTRHNANDCIGSGVRLPRGMSSAAMI